MAKWKPVKKVEPKVQVNVVLTERYIIMLNEQIERTGLSAQDIFRDLLEYHGKRLMDGLPI